MARIRKNFASGTLTAALTSNATTMTSAELAAYPAVTAPDIASISLDPNSDFGTPEVVYITAHAAGATSATIVRAQEGSTARAHGIGETWINALTTTDFDAFLKADGSTTTGNAVILAGAATQVPLSLIGAVGQTANVLEIESSVGTVTARATAAGAIYGTALYDNGNRVYSSGNAPPYPVTSVAGRGGAVTLTSADVSGVVDTSTSQTIGGTKTFSIGIFTSDLGMGTADVRSTVSYSALGVKSANTTVPTAVVQAASSQTANIFEWRSSAALLSYVNSSGQIFDNGNRVYSAGNANLSSTTPTAETYGLAGAVGTGTTYARADHAHAMPATPVTSAVAGTGISVSGATGAVTFTNSGVTSIVAGTGITVSGGTGAVTINATGTTITPASTVTSETTYGIAAAVGTGTLYARNDHTHGSPATPVTSAVAGTGIGVSGATGAVTFTNTGVTSIVAGTGISISGATGAVTINSTGGVSPATTVVAETTYGLASAVGTGTLYARNDHTHGTPALPTTAQIAPGTFTGAYTFASSAVGTIPIVVSGFASQTGNLQEWRNSGGTVLARITALGGASFDRNGTEGVGFGGLDPLASTSVTVGTNAAARIGVVIRGVASQSGNLQEWQNSAGAILSRVASDGTIWVGATQLGGGSGSAADTETMSIMGGF